ncbi:MAG: hypothetical protein L0387_36005 [Acidobacteria bacterium]|nr:hypothetical protein [Acidobacteriota bacterium]
MAMSLYDYTAEIRDLINAPWKQSRLYKNRPSWLQMCSALDVVGDTELAIDAFSAPEVGQSNGVRYLAIYGLLQTLYTQQDAVFHLCKALQIKSVAVSKDWREYPAVNNVRNIRNRAIGHPTESGRKAPFSYHFISRVTLTEKGFDLHSMWDDGREEWRSVPLKTLIDDQKRDLGHILGLVVEELRAEAAAHRERFRMEEMAKIFPASLPYGFQNIFQATRAEPDLVRVTMAKAALGEIKGVLHDFSEAATKRGFAEALHLDWTYEEHALIALDAYFDHLLARLDPNIDHRTAYIFAAFLEKQIDYLRQTAKEIDEDFAK